MLITLGRACTQGLGILFFLFSLLCERAFVFMGGYAHSTFSYLSESLCPDEPTTPAGKGPSRQVCKRPSRRTGQGRKEGLFTSPNPFP